MTPLIFALLAIVGVGAAGFALLPAFVGASRAEKRRRAFQGDMQANRRENAAATVRENRRRSIQQTLKQQTDALNRKRKLTLQDMIFQAGLKTSKRNFIRNQIIVGAVVAIVVFVLQVPALYSFIFGVAAGYLLPRFYLSRKRKKYQALAASARGIRLSTSTSCPTRSKRSCAASSPACRSTTPCASSPRRPRSRSSPSSSACSTSRRWASR
jgi:Flp pilus assembly protein TadB